MEGLLLDRKVGQLSAIEFARVISESSFSNLKQNCGTNVFPINCHKNASVNSLSLDNQNFQYLLSGCADSSIKLWDVQEQELNPNKDAIELEDESNYDEPVSTFQNLATIPKRSGHKFGVSCIQWWPFDTGMFVSSSFDHKLKVWDTNELVPVHEFNMNNRVYAFDISNALIGVASDQPFVRLLDLRSSSSAHTLSGHKGKTISIKWHPRNANILATGGFDGEVKIWDIRRSRSCLCRLDMLRTNSAVNQTDNLKRMSVKAHSAPVNGLVWDPLGHTLFTAGNDDKVRVWDMINSLAPPINKLVSFGHLTRNKYLQLIPITLSYRYESELQYLVFPSDNGDVFIYRTIDGKLVTRLSRKGSKNIGRTCSIAVGASFTNTLYCGTNDGEIVTYSPHLNDIKASDVVEEEELQNEPRVDRQLIDSAREFLKQDNYVPLTSDALQ